MSQRTIPVIVALSCATMTVLASGCATRTEAVAPSREQSDVALSVERSGALASPCFDGKLGDPTSCKDPATWKQYAAKECQAAGLVLTSLTLGAECEKGLVSSVAYTCCAAVPETVCCKTSTGYQSVPLSQCPPAQQVSADLCLACTPPPPAIEAWWTGDVNADDHLALHHGLLQGGAVAGAAGFVAGAFRLDGINDWVRVPHAPGLEFGAVNPLQPAAEDFTIDAWIRTTKATGLATIVDKRRYPTYRGYTFYLKNGNLTLNLSDSVSGPLTFNTTAFVADGAWHLVAVSVDRDNAAGLRFYVDGVLVATMDPTPRSASLASGAVFRIGRHASPLNTTAFFRGEIDELELFRRALSGPEIAALAKAKQAGKCKKPCDPDNTPPVITCPWPVSFLADAWDCSVKPPMATATDGCGPVTVTASPSILVGPGMFTVTYTATDAAGNTATCSTPFEVACKEPCTPPPTKMSAWFPFDELVGTTANEIVNNVDGSWINGPTPTSGIVGPALDFGGVSYVNVPHTTNTDPGNGDFSIDAWIYWNGATTMPCELMIFRTPTFHFSLHYWSNELVLHAGGYFATAAGTVTPNAWHLVAVTVKRSDPLGVRLYVDGVQVLAQSPAGLGNLTTTGDAQIGGEPGFTCMFDGVIDELEFFKRALSASEVATLFDAGEAGKCKGCYPDHLPPVLTCPPPYGVYVPAGKKCAVKAPKVTAVDACGAVTVAVTPAIATGNGLHTFTYTATDASGNVSTCSTQVQLYCEALPSQLPVPEE